MPQDLIKHKKVVEQYLAGAKENLSAFSFLNIFSWKDFFTFDFKMIDESLCIFAKDRSGVFMYLPPLGKHVTENTIRKCFDYMKAQNGKSRVARIENVPQSYREFLSDKKYSFYHKGDEYLYFKNDIVALRGNDFKSKRSDYNFFIKNFSFQFLPFEPLMAKECLRLYDNWAEQKRQATQDKVFQQMLDDGRKVHELIFKNFKALKVVGRVVKIEKYIKAYTFGFAINPQVFCVLLEVADLSFKGLPVFIFREFAKDAELQSYLFLNVMDDFGLDHVSKTKMSFKPVVLLSMHSVKERE